MKKPKFGKIILVSGCLIGLNCRYDGKSKPRPRIVALSCDHILIPVCPEQLGGLKTPREPAAFNGERLFTRSGKDVTENFKKGAQEALGIAKLSGAEQAILKQKSPSCGSTHVYHWKGETWHLVEGKGFTAELLMDNGISVCDETLFE